MTIYYDYDYDYDYLLNPPSILLVDFVFFFFSFLISPRFFHTIIITVTITVTITITITTSE